jgi:hypothetical protein
MIELPPPTETGKMMYPDDPAGYYTANGDMVPCTCKPTCTQPCKGQCGCSACSQSYADFGND